MNLIEVGGVKVITLFDRINTPGVEEEQRVKRLKIV